MEPILSMFLRGTANRVLANAITGNVESSLHTCLLLSHLRQGDDSGKLVALRHLSCGDGYENEDGYFLVGSWPDRMPEAYSFVWKSSINGASQAILPI